MGRVSKAFLPYSSDRFPISGVIIIAPNPMICITLDKFFNQNLHLPKKIKISSITKLIITWFLDPNQTVQSNLINRELLINAVLLILRICQC